MSSINYKDLSKFSKIQIEKQNSDLEDNERTIFLCREFYTKSAEHLLDELIRIGILILLFLEKTEAAAGKQSQDFGSLFISEAEANSILQAVCCGSEVF